LARLPEAVRRRYHRRRDLGAEALQLFQLPDHRSERSDPFLALLNDVSGRDWRRTDTDARHARLETDLLDDAIGDAVYKIALGGEALRRNGRRSGRRRSYAL
jgi:hypothetical protein